MSSVLDDAYVRLHATGPEWGGNLTNHGPMAAEVMVRRGYGDGVDGWVDSYMRRLDDLPAATEAIGDDTWPAALGNGRIGDWTAYLTRQISERPWQDALCIWWPRLLPGIAAGATHGVIRVGHAVRTLLAEADASSAAVAELAHGFAFWAARSRAVPGAGTPVGRLGPGDALDEIPHIPEQDGPIAGRLGRLADLAGWPASVQALRRAVSAEDARTRLAELVDAATLRYLYYGHGSPVLLIHTATAPNAVLHTLPALPERLWAPSLSAAWAASAAITATYAPAQAAARDDLPAAPSGDDARHDVLERSVAHADEHVIKFADTAAEVYERTKDPDALAASIHASELIAPAR